MDITEIVLNHLLDSVSHMENREFQINEINYSYFQKTWKQLDGNVCREVGKLFKSMVDAGKVSGVVFKETLSDNHNIYIKK